MRVKIGDKWFSCELGQPIMVELTPGDKTNIANMHPNAKRYAVFHDDEPTTKDEKFAWMADGPPKHEFTK